MPLHDVFLSVRRGEIVGVAGVEGNGQSDLAEAIAGMIPLEAGSVRLCGREIGRDSIRRRRQKGIGHVPGGPPQNGRLQELHDQRKPHPQPLLHPALLKARRLFPREDLPLFRGALQKLPRQDP